MGCIASNVPVYAVASQRSNNNTYEIKYERSNKKHIYKFLMFWYNGYADRQVLIRKVPYKW